MALPLGKLVIVVGAGIAGSVLVNESRISRVSDFFSGAFKVVLKHLKDDGSSPKENSVDNSLMAQISFSSKQAIEHINSTSSPVSYHQASSSRPQVAIEFPDSASSSSSSLKGSSSSPRTPQHRISASCSAAGLKEVQGISEIVEPSSLHISETKECEAELQSHFTNLTAFGRKIPGLGAAFLQRSRSATCSFNKGLSSKP